MPQLLENKQVKNTKDFEAELILHDDPDVSGFLVIESIMQILNFSKEKAIEKTMEAHYFSSSILGTYPLEMAEFYSEQFINLGITVTYAK